MLGRRTGGGGSFGGLGQAAAAIASGQCRSDRRTLLHISPMKQQGGCKRQEKLQAAPRHSRSLLRSRSAIDTSIYSKLKIVSEFPPEKSFIPSWQKLLNT